MIFLSPLAKLVSIVESHVITSLVNSKTSFFALATFLAHKHQTRGTSRRIMTYYTKSEKMGQSFDKATSREWSIWHQFCERQILGDCIVDLVHDLQQSWIRMLILPCLHVLEERRVQFPIFVPWRLLNPAETRKERRSDLISWAEEWITVDALSEYLLP